MAKICLCLTGSTIARNLEVLAKYRKWIDIAELRVDYLDPDERFHIRRFPSLAGVPTILTVRRKIDGGLYEEGEGARIVLLASGLVFADSDPRRNFAYVDLEEDLDVPSLEEAARTFGTRIIRSFHDFQGVPDKLTERIQALRRSGDEIAKAALMPKGPADVARVFAAARDSGVPEKVIIAMGPYGCPTRVLAERIGSVFTYTSPRDEPGMECAGPGQNDPRELSEIYHFKALKAKTRIFGIIGSPLSATSSPAIHNAGFAKCGLDAVYLPIRTEDLNEFSVLAKELELEGFSVTIPHKEAIIPRLAVPSADVEAIGACNTVIRTPERWIGYNTDAPGFSESLLAFIGRKNLRGKRISVIGAGGVARAVAYELRRLGGKACILNRTVVRAKDLANQYGFQWGALDDRYTNMIERFNDIIIQTSSVGMEGEIDADPIALYRFSGRELVMDLIYKPEKTKLLRRAEAAGCPILNGRDMLERQAKLQFRLFTGLDYPD